jgi:hypothetical protein
MVCIQFLAIALGVALGAQATPLDADVQSTASLDMTALWVQTWPMLAPQMPGITCAPGGPSGEKNITAGEEDSWAVIEDKLSEVFPGVKCTGKLDHEAILKDIAASPEKQSRSISLQRRREDPGLSAAVDREVAERDRQVDQKKRSYISGCAGAPHPGNCVACAIAAGGNAVAGIFVCGAQAHHDLNQPGAATGRIWVVFGTCTAKAITNLVSESSSCSLRVSYESYPFI